MRSTLSKTKTDTVHGSVRDAIFIRTLATRQWAERAATSGLFLLCSCLACSSGTGAASNTVNSGGAGGGVVGTGGNGSGGLPSTGGFTGSGGSTAGATGGAGSQTGGVASTGGAAPTTGGRSSTGGEPPKTGGASSTGGALPATGGHTASTSIGGSSSTGGATPRGTGGVATSGGTSSASGGSTTAGSTSTNPTFDACPATGNCKILPLGDSITAGAGAQPGDNGGYRVELFKKAVADSKHITFVGSQTSGPTTVSGQTFPRNHEGHIGWTISQISAITTTSQTVTGSTTPGALRDLPNIVLLFIGTNDEGYASSEAGASDRLAALIDKIVTALPDALLVVSSIYPFPGCQSTNYTPTQCAANVATYDSAIPGVVQQRAAAGKHVLFVDMSNPPTGALSTDGVHPNDTVGYPWMGDTWYAVIKSYLH